MKLLRWVLILRFILLRLIMVVRVVQFYFLVVIMVLLKDKTEDFNDLKRERKNDA